MGLGPDPAGLLAGSDVTGSALRLFRCRAPPGPEGQAQVTLWLWVGSGQGILGCPCLIRVQGGAGVCFTGICPAPLCTGSELDSAVMARRYLGTLTFKGTCLAMWGGGEGAGQVQRDSQGSFSSAAGEGRGPAVQSQNICSPPPLWPSRVLVAPPHSFHTAPSVRLCAGGSLLASP